MSGQRRVALMLDLEWLYKRHTAVFSGTQRYARQRGWRTLIDEHAYDTLAQRKPTEIPYDGIIARATKPLYEQAVRLKVPLVNVWYSSPVRDLLPGVFSDFTAAGRLRAEHLLSRGFRRFAALISPGDRGQEAELKEFNRVIGEAGCTCLTSKVPAERRTLRKWRTCEHNIRIWMDRWETPIGVFVGGESSGRLIVQMCHERGWRVPEDAAIVSGNNEEMLCNHPHPSLSSVEMGMERIGYSAAQLLDGLMDEKLAGKWTSASSSREHIILPPRALIVRESTDFYSVENEAVASALTFISAHCHRAISPADVALGARVSLRSLQRQFRTVLNRSLSGEIRRARIERAKRELTQTTRSIASISHDVGFGHPMRMYDVFRRELGTTPRAYRRQRQAQDEP